MKIFFRRGISYIPFTFLRGFFQFYAIIVANGYDKG